MPDIDLYDGVAVGENLNVILALLLSVSDSVGFAESIEATRWDLDNPVFQFHFTLTGSADGVADVNIPIKNFQARIRNGEPTYLQVVVPSLAYSSQINARPNGDLVIKQVVVKAGTVQLEQEIVRVEMETVTVDEGPKSQSITLVGHKTEAYIQRAVNLSDLTYKRTATGKRTIRTAVPDLFLRPGDLVTADGETWVAGMITMTVDVLSQTMEVTEADDIFSLSLFDNLVITESSSAALS